MIRAGKPAPDFVANAFTNGGFGQVQLSEFQGKKWVYLFFYPGDFTFV